jgi:hypothetical protein
MARPCPKSGLWASSSRGAAQCNLSGAYNQLGRAGGDIKMNRHLIALITLVFTTTATLSAQVCTATKQNADYSPLTAITNNGPVATVTAKVHAVGDLVAITAWCYTKCTPTNVTLGAQSAVKTSVSGVFDPSSPGTGQAFLYYILSASASGDQTLTFTSTGGALQTQVSYIDFSPSAGCQFTHHMDSPLGSCLSGGCLGNTGDPGSITAPSITPTAGDLLFNFTWSSGHMTAVNSSWSCPLYQGPGETGSCFLDGTVNAAAYILSAASGTTANNTTELHQDNTWQALITSFSIVPNGQAPKPPTNVQVTVQ